MTKAKWTLPAMTIGHKVTTLDYGKLGMVLKDAYSELFGVAPHIENESSTRNFLAKRIVEFARMGETDPEFLKQYAMAGFALRNASTICTVISQSPSVSLAAVRTHDSLPR